MNGKKARKLRKQFGITKANLRNPEYEVVKSVKKIVYFRNKSGELSPQEVDRQVVVNKNKFFYRQAKKLISQG